jgi:hypothetical protein
MKKILLDSVRSFAMSFMALAAVILLAGLASAWTGPTGTAPSGNVAYPLNESSATQVKNGALAVTDLVADDVTGNRFCLGSTNCITGWPIATAGNGASMTLPAGGPYDVLVWGAYFTCQDYPTTLRLDGASIKTYTGQNDDTAGCDQNIIMAIVNNVSGGVAHTWSFSRGGQWDFTWVML